MDLNFYVCKMETQVATRCKSDVSLRGCTLECQDGQRLQQVFRTELKAKQSRSVPGHLEGPCLHIHMTAAAWLLQPGLLGPLVL